jgi:hypothetical protein
LIKTDQAAVMDSWRADDFDVLLAKFARRVQLVTDGVLSLAVLE